MYIYIVCGLFLYCKNTTVKIHELPGTVVLNIVIFKTFSDVRCTNELIDLWWMNGELWLLYYLFVKNRVSRFVTNLRIGRESWENYLVILSNITEIVYS